MKTLLDRSFRYTPSFATNLKNTFAKARREMRQAHANCPQPGKAEAKANVVAMDQKRTLRSA